jgi:hypothetical protein
MPAVKLDAASLILILISEIIGTAIFAYGIVSSDGSDSMVSIYLFTGILISYRFSGGHVISHLIKQS